MAGGLREVIVGPRLKLRQKLLQKLFSILNVKHYEVSRGLQTLSVCGNQPAISSQLKLDVAQEVWIVTTCFTFTLYNSVLPDL